MQRFDYMLDDSGDLLIKNGDFVIDESTFQHARLITMASAGDFRQYPEVGFFATRFVKSQANRKLQFCKELREQLENDGITVNDIDVSNPQWWKKFVLDIS